MRRITWVTAIVICVTLLLSACGTKDAASIVKDLDHVVSKLQSYQGAGTMKLYTGQQPQEYQVEVWFQNPSYYRIALKNAKKDITQIVLRNDEGVFVLTPSLNKSFRFQSDWPEKQGQVYLYQTLIQSILTDNARQFASEKESYVFDVLANYQTSSLVRQKIWLNKETYAPQQVQVTDANSNVVVEVKFDQFDFNAQFEKDSFEMQRNMTSMNVESMPTMNEVDESGNPVTPSTDATTKDGTATAEPGQETTASSKDLGSFGIIEPGFTAGAILQDASVLNEDMSHAVLLRYAGDYNYTLHESRPQDREVALIEGESVQLDYTVGLLTGTEQRTLTWTNEGIMYKLTSVDLPRSEMVNIANSLADQSGK